jgi:hypothetical protein
LGSLAVEMCCKRRCVCTLTSISSPFAAGKAVGSRAALRFTEE